MLRRWEQREKADSRVWGLFDAIGATFNSLVGETEMHNVAATRFDFVKLDRADQRMFMETRHECVTKAHSAMSRIPLLVERTTERLGTLKRKSRAARDGAPVYTGAVTLGTNPNRREGQNGILKQPKRESSAVEDWTRTEVYRQTEQAYVAFAEYARGFEADVIKVIKALLSDAELSALSLRDERGYWSSVITFQEETLQLLRDSSQWFRSVTQLKEYLISKWGGVQAGPPADR